MDAEAWLRLRRGGGVVVRKRRFFAELQHQNQLAVRRQQQAASATAKQHAAAVRQAEAAQRQAERARVQRQRATAADQKKAEKEAQRLHDEAMQAEAASMNAQLASDLEDIDSILNFTLSVDDFVDLEQLRTTVARPPFDRAELEQPIPAPAPIVAPPEPVYRDPEDDAKGLGRVFGGKKRHAEAIARAQADYELEHQSWQARVSELPMLQLQQMQEHQRREQQRLDSLGEARQAYEAECQQREDAAQEANRQLDELIAGLTDNDEAAVQEYVSIVLGNSVYPDCFPVEHDYAFDSSARELTLTVTVPAPGDVPSVKEYKYVKSKDEIATSELTQKARKDRYSNAVCQVALRTLHEIFEADRAGRIETIALSLGTDGIDVATGQPKRTPLVAVAADRATFAAFDLANVVPQATLGHLNALVSKNPLDLVSIDETKGVRGK